MECMPGAFVAAADEEDNNGHIHKHMSYNIKREPDETAYETMPAFNENPSRATASFGLSTQDQS